MTWKGGKGIVRILEDIYIVDFFDRYNKIELMAFISC